MRLVRWLIGIPIAAIAVMFAVFNRETVTLDLWPLPFEVQAALYLLVLGMFVVGVVAGLFLGWLSAGRTRRESRAKYFRIDELQREVILLKSRMEKAEEQDRKALGS